MKLLIIFVVIIYVNAFVNDPKQDQCDKLCSINLNEIDMSKFIIGTIEDKQEIALLFDKTFHEYGVIRLINNNITSELLAKAERFFSLDFETKMKYYIDGPYFDTPGYKPLGLESVGNYKGEKSISSVDSTEAFLTFFKSQSKQLNFSIEKLYEEFRDVIPEYIFKQRQLISLVHSIADLALELDENTFDRNYTNDNAKLSLKLTQYLPTKNEEDLAFGEHQDYLGFTLLHNDDVPGKNLRFYKVKFQLVLYEKKLTHCLVCRIRSEHQWKMVSCRS
jgi:isopenicillin N synthase-like dioxygenase